MSTLRRRLGPNGLRGSDRGETLLELMIALMVMAVAGIAVLSGLTLSIKVSDAHRKQATAGTTVRNYAEWIATTVASGGYVAGTNAYPAYPAASTPAGFTASVVSKRCWTGSAWGACSSDIGVQQLTLQVASADGRAAEKLTVIVRKPCAPGQATCS